jgi:hypothetical protein
VLWRPARRVARAACTRAARRIQTRGFAGGRHVWRSCILASAASILGSTAGFAMLMNTARGHASPVSNDMAVTIYGGASRRLPTSFVQVRLAACAAATSARALAAAFLGSRHSRRRLRPPPRREKHHHNEGQQRGAKHGNHAGKPLDGPRPAIPLGTNSPCVWPCFIDAAVNAAPRGVYSQPIPAGVSCGVLFAFADYRCCTHPSGCTS